MDTLNWDKITFRLNHVNPKQYGPRNFNAVAPDVVKIATIWPRDQGCVVEGWIFDAAHAVELMIVL
jgi:hypothetical protein